MRAVLKEIWDVGRGKRVVVSEGDLERVRLGREEFLESAERQGVVYGFNTGLGKLADVVLKEEDLLRFQHLTLKSHATSTGSPLPVPYVRAAMYLRVKNLLKGVSGVRPEVVSRMVDFLNLGITPVVPERGSVGASGDLSPNAHIALSLIGDGWVFLRDGRKVPSIVAHRMYGMTPLELRPREALALINGFTFSLAVAALNTYRLHRVLNLQNEIFPLLWYAVRGRKSPFNPEVVGVMGDRYAQDVAKRIWKVIRDLPDGNRVQDPYSFRAYPQVVGVAFRSLEWAQRTLADLCEGVSDNPVLVNGEIHSSGNFHGQTVAVMSDTLSNVLASLIGMVDRRLHFTLSPDSGLPHMLSRNAGVDSGLMMLQVAVSSVFAEAKVMATPFSFQSSPTSAGQEDWVPMSLSAALRFGKLVDMFTEVLAAELLTAYRALALTGDVPEVLSHHYTGLKERFPQYRKGLSLHEEWKLARDYVYAKAGFTALHL